MHKLPIAGLLLLTIALPGTMQAMPARADGPAASAALGDSDDPAIALVDMLGWAADCLSAYQHHVANEAYLGSAAATRRLRTAVSWAPEVTVPQRAAEPVAGCLILIRRHDD